MLSHYILLCSRTIVWRFRTILDRCSGVFWHYFSHVFTLFYYVFAPFSESKMPKTCNIEIWCDCIIYIWCEKIIYTDVQSPSKLAHLSSGCQSHLLFSHLLYTFSHYFFLCFRTILFLFRTIFKRCFDMLSHYILLCSRTIVWRFRTILDRCSGVFWHYFSHVFTLFYYVFAPFSESKMPKACNIEIWCDCILIYKAVCPVGCWCNPNCVIFAL